MADGRLSLTDAAIVAMRTTHHDLADVVHRVESEPGSGIAAVRVEVIRGAHLLLGLVLRAFDGQDVQLDAQAPAQDATLEIFAGRDSERDAEFLRAMAATEDGQIDEIDRARLGAVAARLAAEGGA